MPRGQIFGSAPLDLGEKVAAAPAKHSSEKVLGNRSDEQPTASFWLGDARLDVVPAAAVDPVQEGIVVGELRVAGVCYVILSTPKRETAPSAIDLLTRRELQIVMLVANGDGTKQIAHKLKISQFTVTSYIKRIFCKLNCRTRAEMAAKIVQEMGPKGDFHSFEFVNGAIRKIE